MVLGWLVLSVASATTPVLYETDTADEALTRSMQRTGLPSEQLRAVSVTDLLGEPALAVGDAVMRHCAGEASTMTQVRSDIARGQATWSRDGDAAAAMDHLDLAIARLGCLRELVEPASLSSLFLLRGALSSDPDTARAELVSAHSVSPGLSWPDAYPADKAGLFEEARAADAGHTLAVSPAGTQAGPWVDGHTVSGDTMHLSPGPHLLQTATTAGITSVWLVIGGDARLVLPANYRRPLLGRMHDPSQRDEIGWLLAGTTEDFVAGYVTIDGGLWLVTQEAVSLSIVELVPAATSAPPPERRGLRAWLRRRKDR